MFYIPYNVYKKKGRKILCCRYNYSNLVSLLAAYNLWTNVEIRKFLVEKNVYSNFKYNLKWALFFRVQVVK